MPKADALRGSVRALLPGLTEDLVRLMAVPSVSARDYPLSSRASLLDAHEVVVGLLQPVVPEALRIAGQ